MGSDFKHRLRNKKVSGWITKGRKKERGAVKGGIGDNRGKRKKQTPQHNRRRVLTNEKEMKKASSETAQGCQMAKFDPFYFLDCARVQAVGAQSKERKGSNFAA